MRQDRLGQTATTPVMANGWQCSELVAPAQLIGANGLRWGPNGQLYVAQAFGGQVSAVDVTQGTATPMSGADGKIIAPDDLAFDSHGNLYVTEVMSARVSAIRPGGTVDIVAADVPVANGITVHGDRIFMSEFNPDGRIWELYADGAAPRLIADHLMMPNALCLGPDDMLYFPLVPLGEIWRVALDNGTPERVAGGFAIPTAVKWDARGKLFVAESGTGAVTEVDPVTGQTATFARVAFGIDNFAFAPDGRMFVSHFTDGSLVEIMPGGQQRLAVPGGMLGPFGLTVTSNGDLVVADGMSLAQIDAAGDVHRPSMLLQHGFPGYVRGVAAAGDGTLYTTNSAGMVARYVPGQEAVPICTGLDEAMGIALEPTGELIVAEAGAGRVLSISVAGEISTVAEGLQRPTGVHVGADGSVLVSEAGAGRLLHIKQGHVATLASNLDDPQGVTATRKGIFVLERGAQRLQCIPAGQSDRMTLAQHLPVGAHSGLKVNSLPGIAGLMPGPLSPFADLAALPDGRIAVSGDETGSIIVVGRG